MSIMTVKTVDELRSISEAIHAEALFASSLQPSDSPSDELVHETVTATMRRLGARTCAAVLASEFGDHPDCATERMRWALATVRRAYPVLERSGSSASAGAVLPRPAAA